LESSKPRQTRGEALFLRRCFYGAHHEAWANTFGARRGQVRLEHKTKHQLRLADRGGFIRSINGWYFWQAR
jgi:hypothetical protein